MRKMLLLAVLFLPSLKGQTQELTFNPFPFWVYSPYLYNPAMTGIKDFVSVDLNALSVGDVSTQVVGASSRISKTSAGYYNSPDILEFRNTGIGASAYHGKNGPSSNIGFRAAASYQIPLSTRRLSYLSLGVSAKGMYNMFDSIAAETGASSDENFYTDADAGIYLYGASFFAGASVTNFLQNYNLPDSMGIYGIPASRQYLFTAGYKIVLSRAFNMVLEPSLVSVANDSTISEAYNYIYPVVKLYVENFCLGSYFLNDGNTSFFFQYRFPKFYIGTFFELPKKSPYYKTDPLIALTIGLTFQKDKSRLSKNSHW